MTSHVEWSSRPPLVRMSLRFIRRVTWLAVLFATFSRSATAEDSPKAFLGPYVFASSDSLSAIARVCGATPQDLLQLNRLTWKSLRDGQALRLPQPCDLSHQDLPKFFNADIQMQREIWRGIRGYKRVALTFDAGGDFGSAAKLLDVLSAHKIPATFFVTGSFAKRNPEWLKSVAAAGHPVYNHSWSHPYFTKLTDEDIRRELEHTDAFIASLTGKPTQPYWRPPYGDRNARVLKAAAAAGFRSVYWTLDSLDSYGEPKSPEFLINRVTNPKPLAGESSEDFLDGAIVLMHANVESTAEALPAIATRLRAQGFSLVNIPQLFAP